MIKRKNNAQIDILTAQDHHLTRMSLQYLRQKKILENKNLYHIQIN